MVHRAPNTLTLIDKKAHGRKRRTISQGFGDAAMRRFEPIIMTHVRKFCDQITATTSFEAAEKGVRQWSTSQNLGRWCKLLPSTSLVFTHSWQKAIANYLTFDIMSDVIFGEAFNLLEKAENRFVVDCIEKSNVRTGVLLQSAKIGTRKMDYILFPEAIRGRNLFIGFVNKLLHRRMKSEPLKRNDVFSFLLDAVDPETQQKLGIAEIGAESTTMIVAGQLRSFS